MQPLRLLILTLTVFLLACNREAPAVKPAAQTSPTATSHPAPVAKYRIASTVPAATLNLVLLGAADSLVGVTQYDTLFLPEEKRSLPIVGDYQRLNYERLLAMKPTAVILQTSEANIPQRLKELSASQHFDIINIKLDTTDDLWNTIKILAHASGKDDTAATAILVAQAELKHLATTFAGKPRPKVVYIISENPLSIVGSNNFMDEMLTLAGADNIGAKSGNSFPPISNETLVKLAPDVLLIGAPSAPDQMIDDQRLETWQRFNIPAVKNHRVFLVTDGNAFIPSLQLSKNVHTLSALIHKNDPAFAPAEKPQPGSNP